MITSGSATSVDVGELPFDMPKLKRHIRLSQDSDNSTQVHTSVSITTNEEGEGIHKFRIMAFLFYFSFDGYCVIGLPIGKQGLTLNLNDRKTSQPKKFSTLDFPAAPKARSLNLGFDEIKHCSDLIDTKISFDRQR